MKIGDVTYDSLPGYVGIETWDTNGKSVITFKELNPGVAAIQVMKSATKYNFILYKWGITDTVHLNASDVDESKVYTLGASKDAKKLKSETTYKIINGEDVPDKRTDYFYSASGRLSKIEYWLRKQDSPIYLAFTDAFEYDNSKANRIVRVNEENKSTLSITSFNYDNNGRVTGIMQNSSGIQTNASVAYFDIAGPRVEIHYTYPGKNTEMYYSMTFTAGDMIAASASTSANSGESGTYNYDLNINPYIHMNWPDLYLSNSSKNNLISQRKGYGGAYPVAEPSEFTYSYDDEGYPKDVVKTFKSTTGSFLFSRKTVFTYY